MSYALPTLETMTPTVDDVFKLVRSYDIAKDGDWNDYLLGMTVYLVKENLKASIKSAIADELVKYQALYGMDHESDDVPDYWQGFDDELASLFAPVIEAIGQEAYNASLPGNDLSDATTVWAICDELSEHISNSWPTITDTLTTVAGLDKIKMDTDAGGKAVVWIEDEKPANITVIDQSFVPPSSPAVIGLPKLPNAPPTLAAIQGQPNGQLLAEAFSIIRDKATDAEYAHAGIMSRSTFLNYGQGRSVPKLRVAQAAGLRQLLDKRLERLQHAINILAQVTRD